MGQAEKEFKVAVEAIGHVRHKNLVSLLGYCVKEIHTRKILVINLLVLTSWKSRMILNNSMMVEMFVYLVMVIMKE
ncbi:putative receptor-like protein kinase [Platanthera zijinensis]|uniref:Receptor-like protein kinase n=1 Tax=Platanthera zijinensis TaxID=2320716 RepID=A0AAP0GFY8_9ASPA